MSQVSIQVEELQPPFISSIQSRSCKVDHFRFLGLPLEIRYHIYRYVLTSPLSSLHRPELWRPVGVDESTFQIGYFPRGAVLSLLLVNYQVHGEAVTILYGENVLAFHVSGFCNGPLAFFSQRSLKQIHLCRKLYLRTGFIVTWNKNQKSFLELKESQYRMNLKRSIALVRKAWPSAHHAKIEIIPLSDDEVEEGRFCSFHEIETDSDGHRGASGWYIWKMDGRGLGDDMPRVIFKQMKREKNEGGLRC